MPVASLCGLGPAALTALSQGGDPALAAASLCQIGLRSVDDQEKRLLHSLGVEVYDMRAIDELGMREVMRRALEDRKSTRLNSSHSQISYAVFCLKKKKK